MWKDTTGTGPMLTSKFKFSKQISSWLTRCSATDVHNWAMSSKCRTTAIEHVSRSRVEQKGAGTETLFLPANVRTIHQLALIRHRDQMVGFLDNLQLANVKENFFYKFHVTCPNSAKVINMLWIMQMNTFSLLKNCHIHFSLCLFSGSLSHCP